ncbi:tigger transposable element-derived protein 6-like [Nematostella vectensis]|uniref:tigger transposable element-derived protein 6-like n=1 Tax=Nematostella vectensis TaxID=45351 RepID=UPI0020774FFF|nr:tigger transposable element-derived protein 6-like [Nematostella vectensis]
MALPPLMAGFNVSKSIYNMQRMATAGEDGDVSLETLESWNERVREITRGWKPENVWNMDETGSFWKGLPDSSLNERGKRCNGGKSAKQRNAWAFFANSTGEKEDPIVIGNAAKPRCFKNMKNLKRPYGCWYYSKAKSLDDVRNHGRSARAIE